MAYSKTAYEATKKYKERNIKRVPLDMKIEDYNLIKQDADLNKESVNGWIKKAIKMRMENNNKKNKVDNLALISAIGWTVLFFWSIYDAHIGAQVSFLNYQIAVLYCAVCSIYLAVRGAGGHEN